jgi:Tol biopolymer transport system component
MFQRGSPVLGGLLLAILLWVHPALASAGVLNTTPQIERITAGVDAQGGGGSYAAISADGRFVVFESPADDLVNGHIADSWDVLVYDRPLLATERASVQTGGSAVYNPGDYTSAPAISGSGRYVAFMSRADDLTSPDQNNLPDIFVHDREMLTTEMVSIGLKDQPANGPSFNPAISIDGRYVVFQSLANNLVVEDHNDAIDIFVRDRQQHTTELVSVTGAGEQGLDPHEYGYSSVSISADGRFVAFTYQNMPVSSGYSGEEPAVFIRDRQSLTTRFISIGSYPALSADGEHLAFVTAAALEPGDQNEGEDVYVFHGVIHSFERVSVSGMSETAASPSAACPPSLSANGRWVAFATSAKLAAADNNDVSDIYLHDSQAGTLKLITDGMDGEAGNAGSCYPAIAADGSAVAFSSMASNLVAADGNQRSDVFYVPLSVQGAQLPITLKEQSYIPFLLNP